jgi:signal transduction histidine kinase/ActR/RegA family two-component response regulator
VVGVSGRDGDLMSEPKPERAAFPSPVRSFSPRSVPTRAPRVLVAVADPALRERTEAALAPAGEVVAAADASSALASAFAAAPDVVVADSVAGADVVRGLRADARTRGIPVIMITERAAADRPLEGLAADADEYLIAPVPPAELAARVSAQARRAWIRDEALRVEISARSDAESSNRAKDEFIAMISHELRTPLGAILIWAQLLKSDSLDPAAVARAVGMIERSTKTLAQLIDDLLDASRIIAGKLSFEARPLELRPVVEAALDAAVPAAQAKDIAIERVLPAGPMPPVSGDPGRLQQVVSNLLANAVKFTGGGGRVEVRLERSGPTARITVADTGSGISPDFLPFIFERFRQADTTSTRKQKGLGLGLAIARQIVQLHGGTIEAASAGEGRGTTFTVTLPLLVLQPPAVPARTDDRPAHAPTLEGITVLVVDDEEDAREAMAVLLGQAGARVVSVGGAADALDALDREQPDVLLSDIAMPGEDGYALIRRVRAGRGPNGGRIPAAALTAYATLDDRAKAIRAGYDEHIPKPVDPVRLVGAVALLVEAARHDDAPRRG